MKVAIGTLGCKVNIYESEYMASLLSNHGYEIVDFDDKADIYVINTCSVTNASDAKSRKMIHMARKKNPSALVIAMGCYSQIKPDTIKDTADIILGNKDKSKIIEFIEEFQKNHHSIQKVYDLTDISFEPMEITSFSSHTRAFVKIQDGCDAFCSYCIIPYTRGPIRSKEEESVVREVRSLVQKGYKEIVLTGIHTGKYGKDRNTNLYQLLQKLVQIPNLYRIRISSIEINELTDELIEFVKAHPMIARHFHIPLQSGCDEILKKMNRKYDTAYFLEKVKSLRQIDPNISLTTDLIVGFPSETEENFEETYQFLKRVHFSKIHTFPYSKRDHTKAAEMSDQIDGITKKNRVHQILELSHQLEYQYAVQFWNQTLEILTEEYKDGYTIGHTSNYLKIYVEGNFPLNQVIQVQVVKVTPDRIFAELLQIIS